MKPSTWNDTNQHWIPQFLLKGFGIRGKASMVYVMEKQTMNVRACKVKKVASKSGLLTETDDHLMRDIEGPAAEAINSIRKGYINRVTIEERQIIDKLVCTMILNDPYSHIDVEKIRKEVIGDLTDQLDHALLKYGGVLNKSDITDYFDEKFTHDRVSVFMVAHENQLLRALNLMGLQSYKPPEGEYFIIGDSPVLVIRNGANGLTSLLNPGSQVILPISSTCILMYSWARNTNVLDDGGILSKDQVRSLNGDYFHGTTGPCLYGRDEEVLRGARLRPLQWVQLTRSQDVGNGWLKMQQLERNAQQQARERDTAQSKTLDATAQELVRAAIIQSENSEN